MPTASNDGVDLHYDTAGEGATVALVGDVGFGAWQWAWQYDAIAGPYRTLVHDHRGTGRSDAPEGPYDVATLAADLAAVLADAGADSAHLVGAGLGGLVAVEYARRHSRAETLTLLGTAASGEGVDPMAGFAPTDDRDALRESLSAVLSAGFLDEDAAVADVVEWRAADDAGEDGWRAQAAAVESYDGEDLYEVTLPTLVLHGEADEPWPPEGGRALAEALPRGEFRPVPEAAHLLAVDAPRVVTDAVTGFLETQAGDPLE